MRLEAANAGGAASVAPLNGAIGSVRMATMTRETQRITLPIGMRPCGLPSERFGHTSSSAT